MENNIKALRLAKQETQADLVRAVNLPGFDVTMLSKIENGHCVPTPEVEKAILSHLQATRSEIYPGWKEADVRIPKAHTAQRERKDEPPFEVEELVACLRFGWKNAKTRFALRQEMDVGDRRLRKIIQMAQEYGYLIGNLTDGNGYFLIDDVMEGKEYYHQEFSRAMETFKKIDALGRWLRFMGEEV